MKKRIQIITTISILLFVTVFMSAYMQKEADDRFVSYTVDPAKKEVKLYWKDNKQQHFKSIQNLKSWLEKHNQKLEFAMNGGMYTKENAPQGLYIENKKMLSSLDSAKGNGNFYLKPTECFI